MDTTNLKKAIKQVAKILFICFLLSLLSASCKNQKGNYYLTKLQKKYNTDEAVIVARIFDKDNTLLLVSALKVNNDIYKSDSTGRIIFNLLSGTYDLTGLSIHFEPVKIEGIEINRQDSVLLDFVLPTDKSPLK